MEHKGWKGKSENMKWDIFRPKFKRRNHPEGISMGDEVGAITECFKAEITGPGGILEKCFKNRLRHYDADKNPIGEDAAKRILSELLAVAVDKRKQLGYRFEQSITQGDLYNQYYKRLEEIDKLTILANRRLQEMLYAQEQYLLAEKEYKQVLGKSYETALSSNENVNNKKIWNDKAIGDIYSKVAKAGKERQINEGATDTDKESS